MSNKFLVTNNNPETEKFLMENLAELFFVTIINWTELQIV